MARKFLQSESLWTSTVAFMTLFEDLEVRNYTERFGEEFTRRLKVDVSLATKERVQYKLLAGGHKELEQADTRLPRISIQITNITPDTSRYTGKNVKRTLSRGVDENGKNLLTYDIQPFPINIEYSVSIWAKYFEHYAQILENIIPYFDPYVTVGVKERNLNIERELKVELTGVGQSSTFEMAGAAQRLIRGDLNFKVQTVSYKYLNKQSSEIIEKVQAHVIDITSPISSETITICGSEGDYLL